MARRPRVDSVSQRVRIAGASGRAIMPPSNVPLDKAQLISFANIVAEQPSLYWTGHKIEFAAKLAMKMAAHDKLIRLLDRDGYVIANDKGALVAHPAATAAASLAGQIVNDRRSLGIHSRGQDGEARDVAKRRAQAKETEDGLDHDDDLLARPN